MKKIFALAMVVVLAFTLCACYEKSGTPASPADISFEGSWEAVKIESMGKTVTGEAAGGMVFNIKADGTGSLEVKGEDGGSFTWTSSGDTITITDEAQAVVEGKLIGNELVFENFAGQNMNITFARK